MRTLLYYITGAIIGVALAYGAQSVGLIGSSEPPPAVLPASIVQTAETTPQGLIDANDDVSNSRQNSITRAVKDVSPAVVGISVIAVRQYIARHPFADDPFLRNFFPDQIYQKKVENLGSGFIISPDGYILTNEHVVHDASQVVVTSTDGEKYDAKVIGFDYDSDVALLKIDGANLPFIPFGDSDDIIIGEWAIAIGNPFGLFSIHSQPSVTVGVVSAVDRDFDRNQEGRLYSDMIQTDAAINRGNSGGPLVNATGALIGMNTMIFTEGGGGSIGLGFAIPSNKLKLLIEDIKGRGTVDRDFWVGLQVQDVNRVIARSLRLPEVRGVVVTDVEPGSPAEKAGLESPDVILGVNGVMVGGSRDMQTYMRNSDLRVGGKLKFNVFRNGKMTEVTIKLTKRGS